MICFFAWVAMSLLFAFLWSQRQRSWKRRRGTLTLPPKPSTPIINTATLVQTLRTKGYRGTHPADRKSTS